MRRVITLRAGIHFYKNDNTKVIISLSQEEHRLLIKKKTSNTFCFEITLRAGSFFIEKNDIRVTVSSR